MIAFVDLIAKAEPSAVLIAYPFVRTLRRLAIEPFVASTTTCVLSVSLSVTVEPSVDVCVPVSVAGVPLPPPVLVPLDVTVTVTVMSALVVPSLYPLFAAVATTPAV